MIWKTHPLVIAATTLLGTSFASADIEGDESEQQSGHLKGHCEPSEPASVSSENKGLSVEGRFGMVGGSYMLGGGITTPWFLQTFRINMAMHAAFYTGALDSDLSATWTPFGYGHARLEIGPPFFRSAPLRPYGFGGLTIVLPNSAMTPQGADVGGLGGLGLEVGLPVQDGRTAPVTYGFEFAGIGNGASVETPAREENLISGFSASGIIRGYFW